MTNVARTNECAWQYLAKFCIWTASANIQKPRNKGTCSWMAMDDPHSKKIKITRITLFFCVLFLLVFSSLPLSYVHEIPQFPRNPWSIIPGESEPLTFPFLSFTVAWLSQEECYLESSIFGFSAASLTNNSGTTGKGCHKTWIPWYQNKSCINRTRSTIT